MYDALSALTCTEIQLLEKGVILHLKCLGVQNFRNLLVVDSYVICCVICWGDVLVLFHKVAFINCKIFQLIKAILMSLTHTSETFFVCST